MALGKYTRVDGRKPLSSNCSTVIVAGFVVLCLVGVWMLRSSLDDSPVQIVSLPSEKQESQVRQQMIKNFGLGGSRQLENMNITETNVSINENVKLDENDNDTEDMNRDRTEKKKPLEKKINESSYEESHKSELQNEESRTEDRFVEAKMNGDENNPSEESAHEKSEDNTDDNENKIEGRRTDDSSGATIVDSDVSDRSEERASYMSQNKTESNGNKIIDQNLGDKRDEQREEGQIEGIVNQNQNKESGESSGKESKPNNEGSPDVFPSGAQSELMNETTAASGAWATQAAESKDEKEGQASSESNQPDGLTWKLCDTTAGPDFIPCLDNLYAIRNLRTTKHYEHRERHCPAEPPMCLIPLPQGYKRTIEWPQSRERIWYGNVPHTKLVDIKGHQNWVKVSGEYLTFPGGGTQFKRGAPHYIEFIEDIIRRQNVEFSWGRSPHVVMDVGCGVASFGGYLFDKDVLTMSFAPKDEHEAQVQFALERGIPAVLAVMGTTRLPFPGIVFDVVHCARCRVPWHIEGGKLLLELNRVLRPGGFFIWSATPVYKKEAEDKEIWKVMSELTKSMCWKLIAKERDPLNKVGVAVYKKPTSNECYDQRSQNEPPLCPESNDCNAAWNVPLQACMHRVPSGDSKRGSQWPLDWPARVGNPPYWLTSSEVGVYGKPAPEDFTKDDEHWKRVVSQSYLQGLGIDWSQVRNVMDMRSIYGGFAAALRDLKVWVMNVVTIDSPDTLPIIYERGLFGMYHDWCESFSTYPRSYDLVHADHLFSKTKKKCSFLGLIVEVDRILRPDGKLIVRDDAEIINELESILRSLRWEVKMAYSKDEQGLLCAQKTLWRPNEIEKLPYAIA